ncbi:MAG: hypothetical protein KAR79_03600, partial [Simkaniaceae bacterium]|nr:hypothetical protein [Simkaniaceae bacterium]
MIYSKPAALNTGNLIHHLDHLGPLCCALDMPLITDSDEIYLAAKKYYPKITPILRKNKNFTIDYLAKNYDSLFVSSKNVAKELGGLIHLKTQKKIPFFFCPHGNS